MHPFVLEFWRKTLTFGQLWGSLITRQWPAIALGLALSALVAHHYYLGVNESASLPNTFFAVKRHSIPSKGDYLVFTLPDAGRGFFKKSDATLIKRVVATAGDRIEARGRLVYVNGVLVAVAKERSLEGAPLKPVASCVVPPGQVFVLGLHRDSLDSRYTIVGLVPMEKVVGVATPII
jgi:conjugal transfer pilin signal peptidase TrbI